MSTVSRFLLLAILLGISIVANVHSVAAYSPQPNDYFNYSETITVNNGGGIYTGYSDQTSITGMERVGSVSGSTASTHYSWSSTFRNSTGSYQNSSSGGYTWSSSTFAYINGTDDQYGYSNPHVWFAMNPSLQVGGTFEVLNTQFMVLSKGYSFPLQTNGTRYILTIQAQGTGQFQRNDVYGMFTASYTWTSYFDPTTGYIVGYNYGEQDSGCWTDPSNPSLGCQSGSFTWTDNLGVTATSYALTLGTAPSVLGFGPLVDDAVLVIVVILLIVGLALYIRHRMRRMDKIPEHPPTVGIPAGAPSTQPWESKIDLGSRPQEQVVLRDVAMKNCKYCGILIPTTAEKCPYCGGANQ